MTKTPHPNLWAALGALLTVTMDAAEGAESHGLADATDWLTEFGNAVTASSAQPFTLTVEPDEDGNFAEGFEAYNSIFGSKDGAVQGFCAAGRITLEPTNG